MHDTLIVNQTAADSLLGFYWSFCTHYNFPSLGLTLVLQPLFLSNCEMTCVCVFLISRTVKQGFKADQLKMGGGKNCSGINQSSLLALLHKMAL